jgi:hypothetical protein
MPRPTKQPANIQQHSLLDIGDTLRTAITMPAIRQELRQ